MKWNNDSKAFRAPVSEFIRDVWARELVSILQGKRAKDPDNRQFSTWTTSGDAMVIGILNVYNDGSEHYDFYDCSINRNTWGELSEILPE